MISLIALAVSTPTLRPSRHAKASTTFRRRLCAAPQRKTRSRTVLCDNQAAIGSRTWQRATIGADPGAGLSADTVNAMRSRRIRTRAGFCPEGEHVRWTDISMYQGITPAGGARQDLFFIHCNGVSRLPNPHAAVKLNEDGWRDRVAYMREAMAYFMRGRSRLQ